MKKFYYSISISLIVWILAYYGFKWYIEPLGHVDFTPVKPSESISFATFLSISAYVLIRTIMSPDDYDGGSADSFDSTGGSGGIF